MDESKLEVRFTLAPRRATHGSRQGAGQQQDQQTSPGRVPRVSRLLALAMRFQDMVDRGEVRDFADLARLGYVTRARITQIMDLTLLAPDIQEEILFLPPTVAGADRVKERDLRPIAAVALWPRQRKMWATISDVAR
ncbi:conserved hypothetical protein [Desulfarculus baarsii DSM 2075]|uniref:Uncharacterized protein n=1 Tax=Desulfarculus baarsii (strain ATCC 33931 / DSM 2075 / LMG 7858 / VKM B-1802 / 2st14) TaxID=644282 RepID=E1QK69_DESB2|nr:hypothetical protein [Desulfarculus baarsii]ADK85962.1 conserved hypothetical protein [Desulfarculus baarsii DSM 2075]